VILHQRTTSATPVPISASNGSRSVRSAPQRWCRPADGEPLVLYDACTVSSSDETDAQCEGCLRFFDLLGMVEQPLRVEVEHAVRRGHEPKPGTAV